jgi:glycosyltransferase involved in cell wall biosynthesis
MPSVSVVIPSYNRANLIGATIENLLRQTLVPREIIVVDDGSTDASCSVAAQFPPPVRLIKQANQGPGAARNTGIHVATGKYIALQDSDDLYSLNKLEAQAEVAERTGADIVFGPWVKAWIDGSQLRLENHVLQQAMPPPRLPLLNWWFRSWSTVFQSLLVRSSFLRKVGEYRSDIRLGEDNEFLVRCLLHNPRVAFAPEALTVYRLHHENKLTENSGRSSDRRIIDWARCLHLSTDHIRSSNVHLDFWTRSLFAREAAKQIPYVKAAPDAAAEDLRFLVDTRRAFPGTWLRLVDLWVRLQEKAAQRRTGARWTEGFQSGAITANQVKLVEQLGFSISR